jgi:hypothetical protein
VLWENVTGPELLTSTAAPRSAELFWKRQFSINTSPADSSLIAAADSAVKFAKVDPEMRTFDDLPVILSALWFNVSGEVLGAMGTTSGTMDCYCRR